jgi:hypothetical protein
VSSYIGGSMSNELVAFVPVPINTDFEETLQSRKVVESADGIARDGNWCVMPSSKNNP